MTSNLSLEDIAVISQWDKFNAQRLTPLTQSGTDSSDKLKTLKFINEYLSDRTYLAGNHRTSADVKIFNSLETHYQNATFKEKEETIHLSRWYRNIQETLSSNNPKVLFSRLKLY